MVLVGYRYFNVYVFHRWECLQGHIENEPRDPHKNTRVIVATHFSFTLVLLSWWSARGTGVCM